MSQKHDSVEAYLGEVATLETLDSIQMLNQLIVKLPNFLPPFIEKLNIYLKTQNWCEVIETADIILCINSECILALMVCKHILMTIYNILAIKYLIFIISGKYSTQNSCFRKI